MPDSCCVIGCKNRRIGNRLSFYRIPRACTAKEIHRRQLWLKAINRSNWSTKKIANARISSQHFTTGKRSDNPDHPDYIPSIFTSNKELNMTDHQEIRQSGGLTANSSINLGKETHSEVGNRVIKIIKIIDFQAGVPQQQYHSRQIGD
ncbi:uncharacterized protein TRIADDRAFT_60440 [Trichoplax adhaerens]|uniref:THAP-type domain-containing protein n=1 Tax=Trichoplax adhaerens TaxID=10228 RepID=B3S879_TRIAD|nr:hypothetical protein TRIADDRAFT_60440 [Trichoplax adhaerens]EDV21054.1 hypothetical protein TRIADDRAFT_60440 [Trichoplax adhaerens]|eukprot:XP_002116384.1 hypothetical protein TRIADDRAFT_60440 [Trichoplax adhaerens]